MRVNWCSIGILLGVFMFWSAGLWGVHEVAYEKGYKYAWKEMDENVVNYWGKKMLKGEFEIQNKYPHLYGKKGGK